MKVLHLNSIFSYYFLKALQDDADTNGDKEISVSEIESYLGKNVSERAILDFNREQTPQVRSNGNSRSRPVVRY